MPVRYLINLRKKNNIAKNTDIFFQLRYFHNSLIFSLADLLNFTNLFIYILPSLAFWDPTNFCYRKLPSES